MFALAVTSPDRTTRRRIFLPGEITIGDRDHNDLQISGADARHARIVIKDQRFILVDLKSDGGTTVNGKRITSPIVIRSKDQIGIADHVLQLVDVAPEPLEGNYVAIDPAEQALLDAIGSGDEDSQLIYADWLEGRGDLTRAEIVRRHGNGRHVSIPFLELLIGSAVAWRVRILRPPIEGCKRQDCPGEWGAVAHGTRDDLRSCATCARAVRYCTDISQARAEIDHGAVVIDPLAVRWSGDLRVF